MDAISIIKQNKSLLDSNDYSSTNSSIRPLVLCNESSDEDITLNNNAYSIYSFNDDDNNTSVGDNIPHLFYPITIIVYVPAIMDLIIGYSR